MLWSMSCWFAGAPGMHHRAGHGALMRGFLLLIWRRSMAAFGVAGGKKGSDWATASEGRGRMNSSLFHRLRC